VRWLAQISARRAILAIVALGLLGGAALGLFVLLGASDDPAQRATARAQWATRTFSSYQLLIEEETTAGRCEQELRITDEQIRQVSHNSCVRLPTWTISNLFTWADQLEDGRARCFPTNVTCACYTIYTARASYDAQLGYPRTITYRWNLRPNWGYTNHWRRLWERGELPDCQRVSRFAEGYITINVLALTPLP
jgi:hypothetical protein